MLYRTAAKSVDEPEVPATTIFPSLCIATALPESAVLVPMSVVTLPSVSKEVSSEPSVLYRTTAKFPLLGAMPPLLPATMIFPSLCIVTAFAVSVVLVPMSVVTLPSVSNEVSSEPSVLYRTTSKSAMLSPTTSIFPLLWIAMALLWSATPTAVVTLPPVPKVVSSAPSAAAEAIEGILAMAVANTNAVARTRLRFLPVAWSPGSDFIDVMWIRRMVIIVCPCFLLIQRRCGASDVPGRETRKNIL